MEIWNKFEHQRWCVAVSFVAYFLFLVIYFLHWPKGTRTSCWETLGVDSAPFISASSDWEADVGWALAAKLSCSSSSSAVPPRPVAAPRLRSPSPLLSSFELFLLGPALLWLWACKAPSDTETRSLRQHGRTGYLYFTNALYIYSSLVWDWRGATLVRKKKKKKTLFRDFWQHMAL